MRLIKTIIFFALLGYGVLFCVENFQITSISVPFVAKVKSVPLFLIIIGCMIFGILIGSLIGAVKDVKHIVKGSSARSENKQLKKKVDIYEAERKIQEQISGADELNH